MSTTSSTTLDVFQTIMGTLAYDIAYFIPILMFFAFMLGLFTMTMIILGLWKKQ